MKTIHEEAKDLFGKYKTDLELILKDIPIISIDHVGATAVPGSITKGDLDINISIKKEFIKNASTVLSQHFLPHHPELWTEEFSIFHKNDTLEVDLMIVAPKSKFDTFIKFRDILISDNDALKEYNQIKNEIKNYDKQKQRDVKKFFYKKILKNNGCFGYE